MNATNRYLDAVREKHGLPSDRKLGQHLGILPSRITLYRNRGDQLTEEHALAVAKSLGVPFAQVWAELRAERTKSAPVRAAWLDVARRLGGPGAAAALVLALLGGVWPSPAPAAVPGFTSYTLCEVGRRRRWAALMLALFGADTSSGPAGA